MPVASVNIGSSSSGSVVISGIKSGSALRSGAAVGIADVAGVVGVYEVSSTYNAGAFCGFVNQDYLAGEEVRVVSVRGSTVTPISQGAVEFNHGARIFLSPVLGEVTQTAPISSGNVLLQVGVASSKTQLILLTDFRVG